MFGCAIYKAQPNGKESNEAKNKTVLTLTGLLMEGVSQEAPLRNCSPAAARCGCPEERLGDKTVISTRYAGDKWVAQANGRKAN